MNNENELYKKFLANMPVFFIDLIIKNPKGEVLLVKRKDYPVDGEWWTCCGRLLHGEGLVDAVTRISFNEIGLKCMFSKAHGMINMIFEKKDNMESDVHMPTMVIELVCDDINGIEVDEYKWVDYNCENYNKYVQDILAMAELKYMNWIE